MRLLVIKPSSLGDVVHAFPAVDMLRRRLGSELESLTWVVNDSLAGILGMFPGVDRIVKFPRSKIWHHDARKAFLEDLRKESYDVSIDFQGLLRSGLMSWASRAPRRIGFSTGREGSPFFYTEKYAPEATLRHAVEKNGDLVRQAFPGCDELRIPDLNVNPEWLAVADNLLADCEGDGPVLAVGCSSRWASKNWPTDFFAAVLDAVSRRLNNVRIWLLGAPDERPICEQVVSGCKTAKPLNLAGKSNMTGLVGLLARSHALLTNDSGPMHIAAALKKPCVALFGATNPVLTGPYGPGLHVVFRSGCSKSPCFKKQCPLNGVQCSHWTDADAVADAIVAKLATDGGVRQS